MYVMNEFGFHDMDTLMENRGLIKLIHRIALHNWSEKLMYHFCCMVLLGWSKVDGANYQTLPQRIWPTSFENFPKWQ